MKSKNRNDIYKLGTDHNAILTASRFCPLKFLVVWWRSRCVPTSLQLGHQLKFSLLIKGIANFGPNCIINTTERHVNSWNATISILDNTCLHVSFFPKEVGHNICTSAGMKPISEYQIFCQDWSHSFQTVRHRQTP